MYIKDLYLKSRVLDHGLKFFLLREFSNALNQVLRCVSLFWYIEYWWMHMIFTWYECWSPVTKSPRRGMTRIEYCVQRVIYYPYKYVFGPIFIDTQLKALCLGGYFSIWIPRHRFVAAQQVRRCWKELSSRHDEPYNEFPVDLWTQLHKSHLNSRHKNRPPGFSTRKASLHRSYDITIRNRSPVFFAICLKGYW